MPAPTDRLRQLYLFTGVFPVGLFVLGHVVVQLRTLAGPAAYERVEIAIRAHRGWPPLEAIVLVSLAFHIACGVRFFLASLGRPRGRTKAPPIALLRRAASGIALAFVAWHLFAVRIDRAHAGLAPAATHASLAASLSSTVAGVPLVALAYLLGTAACAFHFGSTLAAFVASSGVASSPRGRRAITIACAAFGAAIFVASADATVHLATGARHFWR